MKNFCLSLVCLSVVLFTSCNSSQNKLQEMVTAHFDALNHHNLDALASQYNDSSKIASVGWDGIKTGAKAVRENYKRYFTTSPDLIYVVKNTVIHNNIAIVEYTSTGTMAKPEKGEPDFMTGKKYTLQNCTVFTFAEGKISTEMTYFDQVAFLRQVGYFDHVVEK